MCSDMQWESRAGLWKGNFWNNYDQTFCEDLIINAIINAKLLEAKNIN